MPYASRVPEVLVLHEAVAVRLSVDGTVRPVGDTAAAIIAAIAICHPQPFAPPYPGWTQGGIAKAVRACAELKAGRWVLKPGWSSDIHVWRELAERVIAGSANTAQVRAATGRAGTLAPGLNDLAPARGPADPDYERWFEVERERFEQLRLEVLRAAAEWARDAGDDRLQREVLAAWRRYDSSAAHAFAGGAGTDRAAPARPTRLPFLPSIATTDDLVGRDDEVRDLRGRISEEGLTVVCGPTGVGKSRLAAEVVGQSNDAGELAFAFWIDAASDDGLTTGLLSLARMLDAEHCYAESEELRLLGLAQRLASEPGWCIVLDDAGPEQTSRLTQIKGGHWLVTSTAGDPVQGAFPLDPLPDHAARALLVAHAGGTLDRVGAQESCVSPGGFRWAAGSSAACWHTTRRRRQSCSTCCARRRSRH